MKHLCLLTFAFALTTSAASAGLSFNGTSLNGLSFNGLSFNGLSFNGANLNGAELNGTELDGDPGHQMPTDAETSGDATSVVVRGLTLADGTQLTVVPER